MHDSANASARRMRSAPVTDSRTRKLFRQQLNEIGVHFNSKFHYGPVLPAFWTHPKVRTAFLLEAKGLKKA